MRTTAKKPMICRQRPRSWPPAHLPKRKVTRRGSRLVAMTRRTRRAPGFAAPRAGRTSPLPSALLRRISCSVLFVAVRPQIDPSTVLMKSSGSKVVFRRAHVEEGQSARVCLLGYRNTKGTWILKVRER